MLSFETEDSGPTSVTAGVIYGQDDRALKEAVLYRGELPEAFIEDTSACKDGDHGVKYYIVGAVTVSKPGRLYNPIRWFKRVPEALAPTPDRCISPTLLEENYCSNGGLASVLYECPLGCKDDACAPPLTLVNFAPFERLTEPVLSNARQEVQKLNIQHTSFWDPVIAAANEIVFADQNYEGYNEYLRERFESQTELIIQELALRNHYRVLDEGETLEQALATHEELWNEQRARLFEANTPLFTTISLTNLSDQTAECPPKGVKMHVVKETPGRKKCGQAWIEYRGIEDFSYLPRWVENLQKDDPEKKGKCKVIKIRDVQEQQKALAFCKKCNGTMKNYFKTYMVSENTNKYSGGCYDDSTGEWKGTEKSPILNKGQNVGDLIYTSLRVPWTLPDGEVTCEKDPVFRDYKENVGFWQAFKDVCNPNSFEDMGELYDRQETEVV